MVETNKHYIGGWWGILSNRMKDGVTISYGISDNCVEDNCLVWKVSHKY